MGKEWVSIVVKWGKPKPAVLAFHVDAELSLSYPLFNPSPSCVLLALEGSESCSKCLGHCSHVENPEEAPSS